MSATNRPWELAMTTKGVAVVGAPRPVTTQQVKDFGCDPCATVQPQICRFTGPQAIGNAELVVQAVNAHDSLVEAAREIWESWKNHNQLDDPDWDGYKAMQKIQAALARGDSVRVGLIRFVESKP